MNLGNRFSQHSFAQIPSVNIARSKFDRSFAVKDTMNFDEITPIFIDEIIPGDTINLNVKSFIRLATQEVPVLDNMMIDFYFFFCPNRLVWTNWERFNGAQDDPGDSTDFLIPTITPPVGGFTVGSVFDHFGIPTDVGGSETANPISVTALPFRGMNLIYNEWFRDQNLQNSITVNKGDGPDASTDYVMLKGAKKHDYFTSMLPWPQKGTAVSLPLGTTAPIVGIDADTKVYGETTGSGDLRTLRMSSTGVISYSGSAFAGVEDLRFGENVGLEADLTEATAATINQFRQAMMVQSILELDARGGTRYVEILRSHFNVISPDFRLQRPEYLSGGTIRISQHPVAQTSESGTTPQGSLAAFSTATELGNNIGFSKSFVEHGYVFGFAKARADVTYQQGLNRFWSRRTRYDFFWPKLQELGEQEVYSREWYVDGTSDDDLIAGYQERYADYRYMPSQIRGQFRSTYVESLDVWHLAEEFETRPQLNSTFIQSNTPIERVLSVAEGYPALLADFWFDYKHARPIVTYGVPATLGRF